jgi:hypothetical protein
MTHPAGCAARLNRKGHNGRFSLTGDVVQSVGGIDAGRVSQAGGKLSIDFEGLQFPEGQQVVVVNFASVPGPIVGAGLPGLIMAGAGLLGWWRRKHTSALGT